jgi:hypothetical protein
MVEKLVRQTATLAAGLVIRVSFVAQPLKFRAAGVHLRDLVQVGSVIFHGSRALQAALLTALFALALTPRRRDAGPWLGSGTALAALALQLASMPSLDLRVAALASGQPLPPGPPLHAAYVLLELVKVAAPLTVAWRGGPEATGSARSAAGKSMAPGRRGA